MHYALKCIKLNCHCRAVYEDVISARWHHCISCKTMRACSLRSCSSAAS